MSINILFYGISIFQHLVTFTIDEDDDVHTVEDAIRKLTVMDAKSKVWIQEMVLQVNSSTVKLLDFESKVSASGMLSSFSEISILKHSAM